MLCCHLETVSGWEVMPSILSLWVLPYTSQKSHSGTEVSTHISTRPGHPLAENT